MYTGNTAALFADLYPSLLLLYEEPLVDATIPFHLVERLTCFQQIFVIIASEDIADSTKVWIICRVIYKVIVMILADDRQKLPRWWSAARR